MKEWKNTICPKCGSEESTVIASAYPPAYECPKCGHMYVKSTQALIDD